MTKHAPDTDLAAAVREAQSCPALLADLAAIYRDVDAELAEAGQTCRACGRCCDFAGYGHRLYVSTAELALLTKVPPIDPSAPASGRCPYQSGADCTARLNRALGCRVFSCDETTDQFEHDLYARHHDRIRDLHSRHGLAYIYSDLPAAMGSVMNGG